MKPEHKQHLYSLRPAIDVHGQWACPGNPKTAQKSIMGGPLNDRAILAHRGQRNWERVWRRIIEPQIDNVLFFTFVRNPWDKAVSAFHFLQSRQMFLGMSFSSFVRSELAVHGTGLDQHVRTQTPTFSFHGEIIPQVLICRFERLKDDWEMVADAVDAPKDIPHRNSSIHKPYRELYDDETKTIVGDLYAEEIKLLGYEF